MDSPLILSLLTTAINEIDYLELPFYLHWQIFGTKEVLNFFLDAGVYVAWALNASTTIDNDQDLDQIQIYYAVENDNRGDFGISGGVGGIVLTPDFFPLYLSSLNIGRGTFKIRICKYSTCKPILYGTNPVVSTNQGYWGPFN